LRAAQQALHKRRELHNCAAERCLSAKRLRHPKGFMPQKAIECRLTGERFMHTEKHPHAHLCGQTVAGVALHRIDNVNVVNPGASGADAIVTAQLQSYSARRLWDFASTQAAPQERDRNLLSRSARRPSIEIANVIEQI
jgi:hypothetical protein